MNNLWFETQTIYFISTISCYFFIEKPVTRLSLPGEIRLEYEEELQRLKAERERLEEKHIEETELLIKYVFYLFNTS